LIGKRFAVHFGAIWRKTMQNAPIFLALQCRLADIGRPASEWSGRFGFA
jgi:hypothetical protein